MCKWIKLDNNNEIKHDKTQKAQMSGRSVPGKDVYIFKKGKNEGIKEYFY